MSIVFMSILAQPCEDREEIMKKAHDQGGRLRSNYRCPGGTLSRVRLPGCCSGRRNTKVSTCWELPSHDRSSRKSACKSPAMSEPKPTLTVPQEKGTINAASNLLRKLSIRQSKLSLPGASKNSATSFPDAQN